MTRDHSHGAHVTENSLASELARVRDQAVRIAQGGEYLGKQIPLPEGRELRDLTAAFNTLSTALHRNQSEFEQRVEDRTLALESANEQLRQEIDARRQAEDQVLATLRERTVLLQEIHHRVKNNLQVISSLLDMQSLSSQDPTVEGILQDSRNRVKAIAFVHEALYQSADLASINLADYVTSLADHLLHVYGGRAPGVKIDTHVEPVSLSLDLAIPCGLLLNELVSNALIHAFPAPGREQGEISIEVRSLPEGRFSLVVADNGAGLPPEADLRDTSSLGLQLVRMLTQQLGGTLRVDREQGTSMTMTFAEPSSQPPPRR